MVRRGHRIAMAIQRRPPHGHGHGHHCIRNPVWATRCTPSASASLGRGPLARAHLSTARWRQRSGVVQARLQPQTACGDAAALSDHSRGRGAAMGYESRRRGCVRKAQEGVSNVLGRASRAAILGFQRPCHSSCMARPLTYALYCPGGHTHTRTRTCRQVQGPQRQPFARAQRSTCRCACRACSLYDAFGVFGTALQENIRNFHSSALKMVPKTPNAS
jgi:hypothetical protein